MSIQDSSTPKDHEQDCHVYVTGQIKDSGTRRSYETGAVRDTASGKGSMVSIAWGTLLRVSLLLEKGAEHYERFNYMKGMSLSDTMDSLGRHLGKYLDGWDDEDHLAAIVFNAINAMETEDKHPELIDHPLRIGKKTFSYKDNAKI